MLGNARVSLIDSYIQAAKSSKAPCSSSGSSTMPSRSLKDPVKGRHKEVGDGAKYVLVDNPLALLGGDNKLDHATRHRK